MQEISISGMRPSQQMSVRPHQAALNPRHIHCVMIYGHHHHDAFREACEELGSGPLVKLDLQSQPANVILSMPYNGECD